MVKLASSTLLFLFVVNPYEFFDFSFMLIVQLFHTLASLLVVLNQLFIASGLQTQDFMSLFALEIVHHRFDVIFPKLLVLFVEFYFFLHNFHFDSLSLYEIPHLHRELLLMLQLI